MARLRNLLSQHLRNLMIRGQKRIKIQFIKTYRLKKPVILNLGRRLNRSVKTTNRLPNQILGAQTLLLHNLRRKRSLATHGLSQIQITNQNPPFQQPMRILTLGRPPTTLFQTNRLVALRRMMKSHGTMTLLPDRLTILSRQNNKHMTPFQMTQFMKPFLLMSGQLTARQGRTRPGLSWLRLKVNI